MKKNKINTKTKLTYPNFQIQVIFLMKIIRNHLNKNQFKDKVLKKEKSINIYLNYLLNIFQKYIIKKEKKH